MIRLRSLSMTATFEVLIQFNILKIPLSAEWLDFFSLSQAYHTSLHNFYIKFFDMTILSFKHSYFGSEDIDAKTLPDMPYMI